MLKAVILNRIPRFHSPLGWYWALGWSFVIVTGAVILALGAGLTSPKLAAAITVLFLMTLPYMLTAFSSVRRDLAAWLYLGREKALLIALGFLLVQYVIYGVGTGTFSVTSLGRLFLFLAIPVAFVWPLNSRKDLRWRDFFAIMAIWLPFNFGLLDNIWIWPEGQAAYVLNTPLAMNLAILLFLGWRNFNFVNLRFQIRRSDLLIVAQCLAGFLPIALAIGLTTNFLAINLNVTVPRLIGAPLGIFFFIAVPEEFLFRGLLQGYFLERWGKPLVAIALTSILFGLSHWHNPGLPDWRYVGLAAIAGGFYGICYLKSGSLAASALLHTAVDTLWEWFFHA